MILRNSGSLLTGCDAIKCESLTNVLKGILKTLERLKEVLCNGASIDKTSGLETTDFSLSFL